MLELGNKGGLIMEVFNNKNELVQRTVGDSDAELLLRHHTKACRWDCPHCYEEACYEYSSL